MRLFEKKKTRSLRTVEHHQSEVKAKRTILGVSIGLLIVVFLFFGWIILQQFRIRTVECEFDGQACPPEFLSAANTLIGSYVFDRKDVPLPGFVLLVNKIPPRKVSVEIKKPIPVIVITQASGERWAVTSDGFLIPSAVSDDVLPIVTDLRLLEKKTGDRLDVAQVESYKKLKKAWSRGLAESIQSIRIESSDKINLSTTGGSDVIVDAAQVDMQLHSLQQLLLNPTIDLVGKEIDLRFNNPVIRDKTS